MTVSMVLGPRLVMDATPVLITAPTAAVVTATELRTMLGLSASDPADALLTAMRDAVVGALDPATGGWLGRALAPQTWELRLGCFPAGAIDLPYPPCSSVTSVKYDTTDGVETTMVEDTDYRVFGLDAHHKTSIAPVYNGSWPTPRDDQESVRIRYVCGYTTVPQAIKSAIALGVKHLISSSERNLFLSKESIPGVIDRQWIVSEAAGKALEAAMGSLLAGYRVWG